MSVKYIPLMLLDYNSPVRVSVACPCPLLKEEAVLNPGVVPIIPKVLPTLFCAVANPAASLAPPIPRLSSKA